jgi:hypothetical protein
MTESRMRAADADRQAAVDRLTEHFTAGRLDLTEFDERIAKAYAATYLDQLRELFGDLPEPKAQEPKRRKGYVTPTPWNPPPDPMPGTPSWGGMSSRGRTYPPTSPAGRPGDGRWFAARALRVLVAVLIAMVFLSLLFETRGMLFIPLIFISMAAFRGARRGGRPWGGPGRPPWR